MDGAADLITIELNGTTSRTDAHTLGDLVLRSGFAAQRIATAVNGRFVPVDQRATTRLEAGDKVEIVSPRQGG